MERLPVTQLKYAMSGRLVLKKFIVKCLFLLPLIGFIYFFLTIMILEPQTILIATASSAAFLIIILFIYEITEFNSVFFDTKDDYILIKRNIAEPVEHMIEYKRIREITIKRDLLDMLFALYTLRIKADFSEGGIVRSADIEGLNKIKAIGLKKLILDLKEESSKKPEKRVK